MNRATELEIVRRAYAKQIMAAAGLADRRLEAAFATVKREDYLGRGPWPILRWGLGYVPTPDRNPVYLCDDVLVGIIPERNLNNGQPSFLATFIAAGGPKPGDHAVHVGAGVGYYTAIVQRLVGRSGWVIAIKFDQDLAARLAANLANARNVTTIQGDGTRPLFEPADVLYVNAGVTRPAEAWLDGLKDGGRLVLPMTAGGFPGTDIRRGAVFRMERRGDEFTAKWISGVGIFPCEGMRDADSEQALRVAFENGNPQHVTRLYRRENVPAADCWVRGQGWCLAYR